MAFDQAIADRVCEELAKGRSLLQISRDEGMPAESTLRLWEEKNPEHAANSLRARAYGCHSLAEECIDIADNGRNDWMAQEDPDNPGYRVNGEHIQRSRLRIDTRMRLIGKWLPKVYGEKTHTELTGPGGGALQIEEVRRTIVDPAIKP